jgi:hypothetical protein
MAEEPQKVPEMLHKVVSALNQGYHKTVKTHQTLITRACQELSTKLDAELGTGMYLLFHFNRRDASCFNQRNIQASWHLLLMARSGSFLFTSAHSLQRPIGSKQRQLADPLWALVCHSPSLKPSLYLPNHTTSICACHTNHFPEFLPQLEALTLTTQALIKTEISRRLAAEHGVTIQIGEKVGLATSRSPIYQSFVWVPHGCPPISP